MQELECLLLFPIYIYVIKKERKKTMFWLVVAKHNAFDIWYMQFLQFIKNNGCAF